MRFEAKTLTLLLTPSAEEKKAEKVSTAVDSMLGSLYAARLRPSLDGVDVGAWHTGSQA